MSSLPPAQWNSSMCQVTCHKKQPSTQARGLSPHGGNHLCWENRGKWLRTPAGSFQSWIPRLVPYAHITSLLLVRGPQSVLFPPAAMQSGTGWSMHCYINPDPVTALKLDWHSPAWDSILQAFHRAVGPSLFFTGTLCRIFTQLAAVSAWNSDHPSLMWHTAHSEVRSSTRFICLLTVRISKELTAAWKW